jgi:hypothetical protein
VGLKRFPSHTGTFDSSKPGALNAISSTRGGPRQLPCWRITGSHRPHYCRTGGIGAGLGHFADTASKRITSLSINTHMGDAKDAVTLQVQMASLPAGINYEQQTILTASAKQLVVTTTNSNYQNSRVTNARRQAISAVGEIACTRESERRSCPGSPGAVRVACGMSSSRQPVGGCYRITVKSSDSKRLRVLSGA